MAFCRFTPRQLEAFIAVHEEHGFGTAAQRLALTPSAEGATQMRGMNHGNALSIYFSDLEDNTVEVYLDTPWYVPQPHGDPLDLAKPDSDIWAETEAICRADPGFVPLAEWQARFGAH